MRVDFHGLTDVGRVRQNNEDAFVIDGQDMLGIVCDGMGGHAKGEVASALATETLAGLLKHGQERTLASALPANPGMSPAARNLVAAIRLANQRILAMAGSGADQRGMGTTVAVMQFAADGIVSIANVGDSRVYRLRGDVLLQLTRDHTYLSDLIEDKEISAEEAKTFRQKNVLSRALGTAPTVKVDVRSDAVQAGDIFLTCSDGLYGALDDEMIAGILHSSRDDLTVAAQTLIDEANRKGGPDNVTVVVAAVRDVPSTTSIQPVKLELQDSEAELPRREKALRRVFPMPRPQESRKVTMLVAAGAALVIVVAAALLLTAHKHGVKPTLRPSVLVVQIQPPGLSSTAIVALNRRSIQLAGEVLGPDTVPETLTVEVPGYVKSMQPVSPHGDTTTVFVALQPEAAVGLRYDNPPPEDHVTLFWKKEGGVWRETTLATRPLVANDPVLFPLEGAGTYTFRLTAAGKDIVPATVKFVRVGQIVSIAPDNPTGSVKVEGHNR